MIEELAKSRCSNRRSSVASYRLEQDLHWLETRIGQLLCDRLCEALPRHDYRRFENLARYSASRSLQKRVSASKRQQLLWPRITRSWPQTGAGATTKDERSNQIRQSRGASVIRKGFLLLGASIG